MESSRRDHSNYMAGHRSVLKKNQNTNNTCFIFSAKTCMFFLIGVLFYVVRASSSICRISYIFCPTLVQPIITFWGLWICIVEGQECFCASLLAAWQLPSLMSLTSRRSYLREVSGTRLGEDDLCQDCSSIDSLRLLSKSLPGLPFNLCRPSHHYFLFF